jgi:hypothetical protein
MGFGNRQPHPILQTPGTEVSSCWNVTPGPNDIRIEGQDAMGPPFVSSHCSLEHKLINFEKKSFVFSSGERGFESVCWRQDNVADPHQLRGTNRIGPQMA